MFCGAVDSFHVLCHDNDGQLKNFKLRLKFSTFRYTSHQFSELLSFWTLFWKLDLFPFSGEDRDTCSFGSHEEI
jgi:hypothetical protein